MSLSTELQQQSQPKQLQQPMGFFSLWAKKVTKQALNFVTFNN
jgi:hypothetical protein